MTPDEIADCRADLYEYSRVMFRVRKGEALKTNWHINKLCDALERVVIGQCKRLIINVPPRSGKTDIAVINFVSWAMGNFPDCEFIHASYSKRLASANTYSVRSVMQTAQYREIFPWTALRADSSAKDEFRTDQGGIVYATGAEGTITGYGAGKKRDTFGGAIIIDDPHKAGEATSDVMRQNVLDWYSETMESRKNSPNTPVIVIMQRLHEDDLSGWLSGGGNGEHWEVLKIPAENEDGTSFWEEEFPIADLQRKKKANAYVYAGQYLQIPAPIGGGIFKDNWWQRYRVTPKIIYRMIYGDTAQKTKEENDFSVFQCWGFAETGDIYLLDMIRGKWEAPDLIKQAKDFWLKQKAVKGMGTLRAMKVEDKVSGTGLIQSLRSKKAGNSKVTVIPIPRGTDKVTRAMDAAPQVEAGRVWIPEEADFNSDFLREHSQFPNAKNDDCVDPCVDAITDMIIGGLQPLVHETAPEMIKHKPFRIPAEWPRAYGIDMQWDKVGMIWAALDEESDTLYVFSANSSTSVSVPDNTAAIRQKGDWMMGASEIGTGPMNVTESESLIEEYRMMGIHIRTTKNSMESGIALVNERLKTGRLKVVGPLNDWFEEYNQYRRDDEGKTDEKDFPLMRATRALVTLCDRVMSVSPNHKKSSTRSSGSDHWMA